MTWEPELWPDPLFLPSHHIDPYFTLLTAPQQAAWWGRTLSWVAGLGGQGLRGLLCEAESVAVVS